MRLCIGVSYNCDSDCSESSVNLHLVARDTFIRPRHTLHQNMPANLQNIRGLPRTSPSSFGRRGHVRIASRLYGAVLYLHAMIPTALEIITK